MGFKGKALVFLAAALLALPLSAREGEQRDSLVRLIKAKTLELIEKNGRNYRKSVDATFLHNGTYLICDSALWSVDTKVINAEGHVKVIQEGTILTSEKMDYLIDEDLVKCRGGVVQLEDEKHNTLRTRHLDYNTKDSVAYFSKGGAMRDSEGQIIESDDGSYDAKREVFTFRGNVNMFTDSVFIKTTLLDYESAPNRANFLAPIDFWKDGNMLSASGGWYLRPEETFFFTGSVHGTTENQEAWCDSLFYYRVPSDVLMLGNVQVQDSSRNVAALANRIMYCDTLSQVKLYDQAAVALMTTEDVALRDSLGRQTGVETRRDTLYMGADTLIYRTIPFCLIPPGDTLAAKERKADILTDPVLEYRQKAAREAAEAAARAEQEAAEREGRVLPGAPSPVASDGRPAPDSEGASPQKTPEMSATPDFERGLPAKSPENDGMVAPDSSMVAPADSVIAPLDSTKIGFLDAKGNIRIYRHDIQIRCDSLRYNELDSIARLYIDPIVWNDGNRQYTADSLLALVVGNAVDRVALENNAMVVTQESQTLFDQIRATEILAYFDSTAALRRFDGLGGANAIFFIKEKERIGTVNKVETKMMSAEFKDGDLDRIYYFDSPKNDVYPLAQLRNADRELKGFVWKPELRPTGRQDITTLEVRPSERAAYEARPHTTFRQTEIYFPGYMKGVYRAIEEAKIRKEEARRRSESDERDISAAKAAAGDPADSLALGDSLAFAASRDSLALRDSLSASDSLALRDSLAGADSLALRDSTAGADSLAASKPLSRAEQRALRRAEAERKRAERIAARDARWAVLDSLDAAKAAAKAAKKEAREQKKRQKEYERQLKQDLADAAKLEKYIAKYRKRKAREDARSAARAQKAAKKAGRPNNELSKTKSSDDGTDIVPLPPLRGGGHPEQRGVGEPALDTEAVKPSETPVRGAE